MKVENTQVTVENTQVTVENTKAIVDNACVNNQPAPVDRPSDQEM